MGQENLRGEAENLSLKTKLSSFATLPLKERIKALEELFALPENPNRLLGLSITTREGNEIYGTRRSSPLHPFQIMNSGTGKEEKLWADEIESI